MVSVFGIQTVCMPDLDHTSSKGGVEYSACFQHSLRAGMDDLCMRFGIQDDVAMLTLRVSFYWNW